METNSLVSGGAAWAISYSLRWLAAQAIYNRDIKIVKRNAATVKKISEFTNAQKDFDLVGKILKIAAPALLGLTGVFAGVMALPKDTNVAISSLSFGVSHLIEAYSSYRINKPLKRP